MTVELQSSRFGRIEIPSESVLDFPGGLIGLPGTKYTLLARNEESAFVWLHSMEDPEIAIPLTNPWRFFANYEVELADEEAERIGITDARATSVYVTVRAADTLQEFCANLRAPILICEGKGHQIINQTPNAPVRAPLFDATAEKAA